MVLILAFAGAAAAQLTTREMPQSSAETTSAPAAPASATRIPPPTPPATDPIGMTIALYYGVIVLFGGAAIAVSVMPGKRGHQD